MSNLTPDEKQAILERLQRDNEKKQQIPEQDRIPVANPDKYGFPIGLDDTGKPFPPPVQNKRRSN